MTVILVVIAIYMASMLFIGYRAKKSVKSSADFFIGGSRFGNYEGLLPESEGRSYYECDIGTRGAASRGAQRLVYSNDGLVYYTADHYESFELLYGEP